MNGTTIDSTVLDILLERRLRRKTQEIQTDLHLPLPVAVYEETVRTAIRQLLRGDIKRIGNLTPATLIACLPHYERQQQMHVPSYDPPTLDEFAMKIRFAMEQGVRSVERLTTAVNGSATLIVYTMRERKINAAGLCWTQTNEPFAPDTTIERARLEAHETAYQARAKAQAEQEETPPPSHNLARAEAKTYRRPLPEPRVVQAKPLPTEKEIATAILHARGSQKPDEAIQAILIRQGVPAERVEAVIEMTENRILLDLMHLYNRDLASIANDPATLTQAYPLYMPALQSIQHILPPVVDEARRERIRIRYELGKQSVEAIANALHEEPAAIIAAAGYLNMGDLTWRARSADATGEKPTATARQARNRSYADEKESWKHTPNREAERHDLAVYETWMDKDHNGVSIHSPFPLTFYDAQDPAPRPEPLVQYVPHDKRKPVRRKE